MITVQLHNLIFACKYNRRALRKVTSSFEEVLYISFPYLDGSIPKGQSYGIFIGQLIRYARINTSVSNFISNCKNLVNKLVGQYFDVAALRKRFQVFINKHFNI